MSVMSSSRPIKQFIAKYWAFILLGVSIIFSLWLYNYSDYKQAQLLMPREWQSNTISRIKPTELEELGMLRKVEQTSHVVYLPNNTYSRVTLMKLYSDENQPLTLHISESGNWDISGSYLQTDPKEFKDITSGQNKDFKPNDLNLIKQVFRMDAQQSRRVDILNQKSILLTGLTYGSTILYSL